MDVCTGVPNDEVTALSEEDLKNGYHLADILTQTCYVFGDKETFDDFEEGVSSKLEKQRKSNRTFFVDRLNCQVIDDKKQFDPENLL